MKRREFITLLGGAAVAWPLAARAQQAIPTVGFLHDGLPEPRANLVAAFRQSLSEAGYIEGRNVVVEYRWARDEVDRLPALAGELVNRHVAVIVAVALTAAIEASGPHATITLTCRRTRSAASAASRSGWFSAQRYSIATFSLST